MRRSCARLSWAMVPTWADGWTVMSRWKAALYTSAAPRCWAFFIRRRSSAGSLHLSMLSRMRVRFGVVMSSASLSGVASTVSSTRARPGSAPWDWRCDMDCPVSRGVEPTLVSPAAKFVLQGLSERSCRGQSEPETRLPGGSEFRGASSMNRRVPGGARFCRTGLLDGPGASAHWRYRIAYSPSVAPSSLPHVARLQAHAPFSPAWRGSRAGAPRPDHPPWLMASTEEPHRRCCLGNAPWRRSRCCRHRSRRPTDSRYRTGPPERHQGVTCHRSRRRISEVCSVASVGSGEPGRAGRDRAAITRRSEFGSVCASSHTPTSRCRSRANAP